MRLNLGCGPRGGASGWVNVDYALGARFAKNPIFRFLNGKLKLFDADWNPEIYLHNLTKRFPWADESADVVYSAHTLEHFSKEGGRKFLAECHRVLKKSGIIRIVVPDLQDVVIRYQSGEIKADDFVEKLDVLYGNTGNPLKDRWAPFLQFPHKCMYDQSRLLEIMDEVGFDVTIRGCRDSDISDIQMVELQGRKEVIVEGRKR